MRKRTIRILLAAAARLGRPYKREFIEAMLWSALNRDGRGYTDLEGYERSTEETDPGPIGTVPLLQKQADPSPPDSEDYEGGGP